MSFPMSRLLALPLFRAKKPRPLGSRKAISKRSLCLEGLEQRIVPFKPFTHLAIVSEARADLIDDGKVTIEGKSYSVPGDVVTAIRDNPAYFNAGAVGPDGFPDLVMGQGVIHPNDSGLWLNHILSSARNWTGSDKPQVLAWAYGYLTHAIGDMWAHTLVNEFTGGPFPDAQNVVTEVMAKSNALKHVLIEGYIADATPGFDGNSDRTLLPNGDVSSDSTPEIKFAAPNNFIYETFVKDGSGPAGATGKGQIIDGFRALRDKLRQQAGPRPTENPDIFVGSFAKTKAAYEKVSQARSLSEIFSLDYVKALADLGIAAIGDSLSALKSTASNVYSLARGKLFSMYLHAWADDIDEGLKHYGEFGLALTNGLFDPQSKRDAQNNGQFGSEYSQSRIDAENKISATSAITYELNLDNNTAGHTDFESGHDGRSFVENHLLRMLGVPDFLTVIIDKVGDITTLFSNAYSQVLERILQGIRTNYPGFANILNTIQNTQAQIQAQITTIVTDFQSAALGVDIKEVQSLLAEPSAHLDDAQITTRYGNIPLFAPGDHAKIDSYLGITNPNHHTGPGGILGDDVTYDRTAFAALGNAVTMSKLLFLDGTGLDSVLTDLSGSQYTLYGTANGNIMTTILPGVEGADQSNQWLLSLDGDHSWRSDRQPYPGDGQPGAGNGNFPLWEDARLRDTVFRRLFKDWQNGPANFPDLGDPATQPDGLSPGDLPDQQLAGAPLVLNLSSGSDIVVVSPGVGAGKKPVYRVVWSQPQTGVTSTTEYIQDGISKITVNGLEGDDTLQLSAGINVPVEYAAGPGADSIFIDYAGTTLSTKAVLSAMSLSSSAPFAMGASWDSTLENVRLKFGASADELELRGDLSAMAVSIDGDDGDDRFVFSADAQLRGDISGGKGLDVIQSVKPDSSLAQVAGLGGIDGFRIVGLPFIDGNISNIDGLFLLSGKSDTLKGLSRASTWEITGNNAGSVKDDKTSRVLAFGGMENIIGGSGDDRFAIGAGAKVSGSIDGGEGSDSVGYAASATGTIALSGLGLTDGFNGTTGNSGPLAGGFTNMNGAFGGNLSPADKFVGLDSASSWDLQAGRVVDVYSTAGRTMGFSGFEVIAGGAGADNFTLDYGSGKSAIAPAFALSGGRGTDSLMVIGSTGDDSFTLVGPFLMVDGKTVRISLVETIRINTGDGNDELLVTGSLVIGMKSLVINLGAGNDKATVSPTFRTSIKIEGGLGVDSLVVISGFIRPLNSLPAKRASSGLFNYGLGAIVAFDGVESWNRA